MMAKRLHKNILKDNGFAYHQKFRKNRNALKQKKKFG